MNPLTGLITLPAELVAALQVLGRMNEQLDVIAESTSVLPQMLETIGQVFEDTTVLPAMKENMGEIEASMPTLVEVQQHLARLPETMDGLNSGLTELVGLMTRLLGSMEQLRREHGVAAHVDRTPRPNRRKAAWLRLAPVDVFECHSAVSDDRSPDEVAPLSPGAVVPHRVPRTTPR